jgi:hypothetical protein
MSLLRSLFFSVVSLSALACGNTVVGQGNTCMKDGVAYQVGDHAGSCGEDCECLADGTFDCVAVPTFIPCDQCLWNDQVYNVGDTFPAGDGCNTCSCDANATDGAVVGCTLLACVTCEDGGIFYSPGDTFPAGDGCNTCSCQADGSVTCTEAVCDDGCFYVGQTYSVGETFAANDGCNECTCEGPSSYSCTKLGCVCEPANEWWRSYVATSPEQCAVIDYTCEAGLQGFENACGCGCEQSLAACKPAMPCGDPLLASCPLSETDCP